MGKLSDLDVFYCGQIEGVWRIGYSISKIVRQLGFKRSTVSRVYQEYIDDVQKTSNRTTCKGQLALSVPGERRLRHNVHRQ
ncbi:uncharacterized protein TNCV_1271421 [Trichonephila clavipes]|nr:uncharacterized protein TNCV_1271421 [Trichonephila clavipes]